MAVYRTCTRLFPGSHLPHLYIGMENLRTNSLATAQLNFQTAQDLSKIDPMILNELGVTHYRRKMYSEARDTFLRALDLATESENWVKESIICNIGHSYRKMGDCKQAITFFERGYSLNPRDGSILFALAFTYHISNQLNKAIKYYNKVPFPLILDGRVPIRQHVRNGHDEPMSQRLESATVRISIRRIVKKKHMPSDEVILNHKKRMT